MEGKKTLNINIHINSNQLHCQEMLWIFQWISHILDRMFFCAWQSTNIIIPWQCSFIKVHLNPWDMSPTQQTENLAQPCACRVCYLLVGYIAVVTLSPVWRRINEWHASTFCWNICDRKISGIFPNNFCSLDQIFIKTIKPGKQYCCVWFFNKLGHAFVKGVRKRGLRRLFSIIKSSENIWQITKQYLPTCFFLIARFQAFLNI